MHGIFLHFRCFWCVVWREQEYQSVSLRRVSYGNAGLISTSCGWSGPCRCLSVMSGLQTPALLPWDTRARLAPLSAAGPNKLSWLALLHSEVSLVVFTTPPNPPLPQQIPLHHWPQFRPTAKHSSWPTHFPTIYSHSTLHLPNIHFTLLRDQILSDCCGFVCA